MIRDRRSTRMLCGARATLICLCLLCACVALTGCSESASPTAAESQTAGNESPAISRTISRGPVSLTVELNRDEVVVGEKLELSLEVTADAGVQVQMPIVEQTLGAFEVRQQRTPPDVPDGDQRRWNHQYVLDTFATGDVELPSLEVRFTDDRPATIEAEGEPIEGIVTTDPMTIGVSSVLTGSETDQDFRDIRGAVDVPMQRSRLWMAVLLAAISAAIVAAAVVVLLRVLLRSRAAGGSRALPIRPAEEIALEELAALESQGLIEAGLFTEFYSRLSDIVRQYIERRFGLMAPERTTEEFLREAGRDRRLSADHRDLLAEFLRSADLVKFARATPTVDDATSALLRARGFVIETSRPQMTAGEQSQVQQPAEVTA